MTPNMLVVNRWLWIALLLAIPSAAQAEVPEWVTYPNREWKTLTPHQAGVTNVQAWNQWVEAAKKSARGAGFQGEDHSGTKWGVAIARGGYLVQTFGDPDYKFQTASVGKCFTMACLQLAIDEGRIKSAGDLIKDYWTGEGQLNGRHKYMDQGHHVFLTFNHLKTHRGAFPITNGWSWKAGKNYGAPAPKWSKWTGDPDKDNYAHAKPGTVGSTYASGGYWRLAQALTAVWKKDLKQVLDEKIMRHIGIPADRWDWTAGQVIREKKDWYPQMPGYGGFLDPPYKIDGQTVRGGAGWVVISAKDLARWGLLVASGGQWKGKRLISSIQGHGGGNGSYVGGAGGEVFGDCGSVTSTFNPSTIPWKLFDRPPKQPENVVRFLQNLYDESRRKYAFRADYPGGFSKWRRDARSELRRIIGLRKIAAQVGDHKANIELKAPKDMGSYTQRKGHIKTEPHVRIPFWLLQPKQAGPFPLAILPHGHDKRGHDTYAGVYHDDAHRATTIAQDRNVAVQAVERGFLAIAPATRGLAVDGVPDVYGRHDGRDCRSQLMHCLLAGRTAIGERVWDLQRIIDWAVTSPKVNSKQILMMGNSGGGMATLYTAACDERITVAVPSCSFSTIASPEGRIYHCDCNMVPRIFEWGDLYDVAGLTAPRHLLAVNGRKDKLHEASSIERAADRVRLIYKAAGYPQRFQHRWGAQGHRFYSDLMWPFVMKTLNGM